MYAFLFTSDLAQIANDGFGTLWENRNKNPNDEKLNQAIDGIQRALQCCGHNGPQDWGLLVPASCCDEGTSTCTVLNAFPKGCGQLMSDFVMTSGNWIAWIAIVFAGFEVSDLER